MHTTCTITETSLPTTSPAIPVTKDVKPIAGQEKLPILPPELIDNIIRFCSYDTRLLSMCALVCKYWLHSSRSYLFQSGVSLKPSERESLLDLTDSEHVTVLPYIRIIKIISGEHFQWDFRFRRFDNAKTLCISELLWERFSLYPRFNFISELQFSSVTFNSFHDLAAVVSDFSNLEKLSLHRITLENKPREITAKSHPFPPPSTLKHFSLKPVLSSQVFAWILRSQPICKIEYLELGEVDRWARFDSKVEDMSTLNLLIERIRKTLTTLELDFTSSDYRHTLASVLPIQLNFARHPELQSIRFCINSEPQQLDILLDFIAAMSSSYTGELVITMEFTGVSELILLRQLEDLAREFGLPHCSGIKRIRFDLETNDTDIWVDHSREDSEKVFREKFAECDKEGRLFINFLSK